MENSNTKFCSTCGKEIAAKAVICPHCGCQTEAFQQAQPQPQIVINNSNQNQVNGGMMPFGAAKNKWVAVLLCLFLGLLGGHKFYEGKAGMGIIYIFTGGLFLIGAFIDFLNLLSKPNPYFVI